LHNIVAHGKKMVSLKLKKFS